MNNYMREIKFRAWDLKQIMMHDWSYLKTWAPKDWEQIDIKVMQYTGLKDKHGKEIYESDIVKCEQMQGLGTVTGVVHYAVHERDGLSDPRMYLDTRPFKEGAYPNEYMIFHRNPEIMGNIYENSDLLTPNT